jgi:hypothetical protein
MSTYVIGDIHGAGLELEALINKFYTPGDEIFAVGDLFDRGQHAHLVWDLIHQYNIKSTLGNHDYKTLRWMTGANAWLPNHYYYALNLLSKHGVTPKKLRAYLESLQLGYDLGQFIITHAAVDPNNPTIWGVSWNSYGNITDLVPGATRDSNFWDYYFGDKTVVYGHIATPDGKPRIRPSSVGVDTGAVKGGPLTAYCLENGMVIQHQSGIDWFSRIEKKKFEPNAEYMAAR